MERLNPADIQSYLGKLAQEISDNDRQRLAQIIALLDSERRANIAQVLSQVFAGSANANAYLRQLRSKLNAAAEIAQLPLRMKVSGDKKSGAQQRWVWFEGGNPLAAKITAFSRRETAELDTQPLINGQQGQPLEPSVSPTAMRNGKPLRRWFLSYAHADQSHKNKLLELLQKRLATSKKFSYELWQDQQLLAGEHWRKQIELALQQADFGLLLLSHAFLSSQFILENELGWFVSDDPQQPAKKRAVPVCLEYLNFDLTDLKGLQARQIFRDQRDKAFSQRGVDKEAWANLLFEHIEKMLDKYTSPNAPDERAATASQPQQHEPGTPSEPRHARLGSRSDYTDLCNSENHLVDDPLALPARLEKAGVEDLADTAAPKVDALNHLMEWLQDPGAPPLFALLAEYGMGKTITCQRLARRLEHERPTNPQLPLPIYLDLRHLTGLDKGVPLLSEIVEECMRRGWRNSAEEPVRFQQVAEQFQQGALVIFDGLDEALVHLSDKNGQVFTRELLKLLPPPSLAHEARRDAERPGLHSHAERGNDVRSGKILISCRTHYFRTLREQKNHFTGQERGPVGPGDYRAMLLLPFSEAQVATYLGKALPEADIEQLQDTIRSVHNLSELTQRPYTLKLVAQFIPQIETWRAQGRCVNGVTLYRQLVLSWLERDDGKHQIKPDHKARLMAHLAAHLWRAQLRSLPAAELESWFHAWLDAQPDLERRYRSIDKDKLEEDLRTATFLVRQDAQDADDDGFRFAHSSVQEYFLAAYLYAAIAAQRREDWAMPLPSPETLDFLGQMLAEHAPSEHDTLRTAHPTPASRPRNPDHHALSAWRQPYWPEASETLLAYALRAQQRGWPLPNLVGIDLQRADLRNWRFSGAENSALNLMQAQLGQADLRGARFDYAHLDGANLSAAQLDWAEFHHCRLDQVDFANAHLPGAQFRHSTLKQTRWTHALAHRAQFIFCQQDGSSELPREALPAPLAQARPDARLALYQGHQGRVNSCAFALDGARLATAGDDGDVRLWDAASGECLRVLPGHQGWVRSCAFAPDGARLASAGEDGCVRLWDVASGECLLILSSHQGTAYSCAFAPDGARLATAGEDGSVRLWEAASGTCLNVLQGHQGRVWSCAFAPNGARLVSAGIDGSVRLWEVASGACLNVLQGPQSGGWSCAFAPDGARLATAGEDGDVRLWDAASGECLNVLQGHQGWVRSCAFAPDGARLASAGGDGSVRLWDAASGACLRVLPGHQGSVQSCAFAPDGARLVTAGDDGRVRLWDADSGACLRVLTSHQGEVLSCTFAPGGARLASAGDDGRVRLWDADSGACLRVLPSHQGRVWSCAFAPDGARLASAGGDGSVRLWEADSGACLHLLQGHQGNVWSCAFAPDGARLASAGEDGCVRLWDADSGAYLHLLQGHRGWVFSCAFAPDGVRLASAGYDGCVRLWDVASGECLRVLSGHRGWVLSCAFAPDGAYLASAGGDGCVRLWDAASGECLHVLTSHQGRVRSCAFAPDGARLASAGDDGSVRLWDADSGACLRVLSGHVGGVRSCAFAPDGARLASAGRDGCVRLWDVTSGACLRIHVMEGEAYAVLAPAENRVIEAQGEAWRWLGWRAPDGCGGYTRLPIESFGALPLPRYGARQK